MSDPKRDAVMAKLEEALAAQMRDQPPEGPGLAVVTRETLGRLLAIEAAAHALLDAIGPSGDMPERMRGAAEALGIALARGR